MNIKQFVMPVAAIASSVALVFWSMPAQAADVPPEVTMTQLNQRVEKLPQLEGLIDGDIVIITDNGKITGANFQGVYTYHPAGSKVTMNDMYARWKDGLVTLRHSTNDTKNKQMLATFIQQQTAKRIRGEVDNDAGIMTPVSQKQVTEVLSAEPTNSSIMRIPDNAWLFRDNGDGTYTALVDVFEFKSGNTPTAAVLQDGTKPLGKGAITQPVPVMMQY
jgi:hypothetical protein